MPLFIFVFGFFLYIYCEISLLVSVGSAIGVLPLILLMIAISAVGIWLIKRRSSIAIWQIRQQMSQGTIPTKTVISSIFYAIAGGLLLIPGFLSDIVALLLLLPTTRTLLHRFFSRYFAHHFQFFAFGSPTKHAKGNQTIFDAEFEHKQEEDKRIK